jgi:hypothetical protein
MQGVFKGNGGMKQTAVEWMFEQLWETPKDRFAWLWILMEAKEMEKEQIKDAYWNGGVNWDEGIDALTYYKETYGKK